MARITRVCTLLLAAVAAVLAAESNDEKDAVAAVQKLFDAMAAHNSEAARAVVMPEGRIYAAREDGKVSGVTLDDFASRLSTMKDPMLERMWDAKVQVHGRIAHVWAEYDFHLNGKFHHCGIDSVGLVKTADGWKVSAIEYTSETTDCKPSPLGTPQH